MKVSSNIAAISLLFASAFEALKIASPIAGSIYNIGAPINILIENEGQEAFGYAAVTFAAPCGNWVQTIPVGNTQIITLPCNVVGPTNVAAQSGSSRSDSIQISIIPVYSNLTPNPCANPCIAPCANPCGAIACPPRATPCGAVACPPRTSCHRRSRRGCRYYAEEANSVEELSSQIFEQQQEQEQN